MNSLSGVMIVGITGQTGAGKTTVCEVFQENGFAIINADMITRAVQCKGSPCLKEIDECFKEKVITDEGELDRRAMAKLVFSNKRKLELLNSICYPYITCEILRIIREYSAAGNKLIILDAPTLFESRADDFCELIISVVANKESRLARIMSRDGLTREHALSRMHSQRDEKFFLSNSDFIIRNDKDVRYLRSVSEEVVDKVLAFYRHRQSGICSRETIADGAAVM